MQQHVLSIGSRRAVVTITRVITYAIYFYLVVVEIILALGFVLLLFGANPSAGFTEWVYRNLDRVMEPFRGIFTPIELGTTSGNVPAILDTSVLFAMIIYGIVAILLSTVTSWLTLRLHALHIEELNVERQHEVDRLNAQAASAMTPPFEPQHIGT